jgi:hypothetical protein
MPMRSVRRFATCIACLVLGLSAAAASPAMVGNVATGLVLSRQDVGRAYSLNRPLTHTWTLTERRSGLPRPIIKELAAKWIAGVQVGFNGGDSVSHQAIMSTADVFRTQAISSIIRLGRHLPAERPRRASTDSGEWPRIVPLPHARTHALERSQPRSHALSLAAR